MVLSLLMNLFLVGLVDSNNGTVYADEAEKNKSESTVGSSGDNTYNILSQSKAKNKLYVKNLNEVLKYDSNIHYLTTLAVLNNELVAKGDYNKLYTGTFKPKGVPESYLEKKTSGEELFGLLGKLEKEDLERLQKDGISEEGVQAIFGKGRDKLNKEEKETLETLEKLSKDPKELEKQRVDFNKKIVEQSAGFLCTVAYNGSGYGGAGFITWNNDAKWWENWTDKWSKEAKNSVPMNFVHVIDKDRDFDKIKAPTKEQKDACIENVKLFHKSDSGDDNRKAQTNSIITRGLTTLTNHGKKYNEDRAIDLASAIRNTKGTGISKYNDNYKTSLSSSYGANERDKDSGANGGNLFSNIYDTGANFFYSLDEKLGAKSTFNSIPQKILGTGSKKDGSYKMVGEMSKGEFEKQVLTNMNKLYGTNYKMKDFDVHGENGTYKFTNRNAYDTLNKYMSINLISGTRLTRNEYKTNKDAYEKTIGTLSNHPYVLFTKYEDNIVGGVSDSLKGLKSLGWTPLYFSNVSNLGVEDTSELKKLMKEHDDSALSTDLSSGYINAEDGLRTAKLRDLIPLKKNSTYSPLMAYDGGSKKRPFDTTVGRQTSYKVGISSYSSLELKDGKKVGVIGKGTRSKGYKGAYQEYFSKVESANGLKGEEALGIDNYGNIIIGNGLKPVIPYWHVLSGAENIYATPMFKKMEGINFDVDGMIDTQSIGGEDSFASIIEDRKLDLKIAYANGLGSKDAVKKAVIGGGAGKDIRVLAHRIAKATESSVKDHNSKFLKAYETAYENGDGELYVTSAMVNEDEESDLDDLAEEFTEADILHKISMMLKYGFSDMLRLTFVGFFVDFYNSTVYNFNVSQVFYSTTFVDSAIYKSLLPSIVYLVGAVTIVFLVIAVVQFHREMITWKRFFGIILAITFVLVMPYIYKFIIDNGMNKVADKMLGKSTRQMMLVDNWTRSVERAVKEDDSFSRLYGFNKDVEFRDSGQDYIVTFATTELIENGCDVLNPKGDACKLFITDKNGELRTDWKRSDFVSVNVSLYDIVEWLEGVDASNNDSAENIVADTDLFTYLSSRADAEDKGYDALAEYKEYKVDTSVIIKDVGLGKTTFTGEVISASDLLKRIHTNANKGKVLEDNLKVLNEVYKEVLKNPEVSNEDLNYVVRDISMTRKSRMALNLGEDKMSPVSEEVAKKSNIKITPPGKNNDNHSGDLFNLYGTIEKLDPHRVSGYKKELEEDIYKLNKETVGNYFSDFALVKNAVNGETDPSYKTTEASIMSTVLWFNINDYFGFNLFPDEYDGSSVSLDNYMRVAYVPLGVFKDPTVRASGEYAYTNVGEYVSLRDNVFNLLVFALNVIGLIAYGLIKWAVIHVILFAITLYGFCKNYIFRYNPDSNLKLGAFVVYGTFILTNILFNGMWWAFGYALNTSYVANDGAVGYPATLVHSIISLAVIGFIIFFIFRKLFSNMRGDMADMGGNNFKQNFSKMYGSMRGALNGALTTDSKSAYGEEVDKEGVSGITREEAKQSNDVGRKNISQLINDDSIQTSNYIMDELNNSGEVDANSLYNKLKPAVDLKTPTGKHLNNLIQDIDSIDTGGNSLISKEDKEMYDNLGEKGVKVSESGNGSNVGVLGFGDSAEGIKQAKLLSKYLNEKGIKTMVEGGDVAFDSGKYDMATPSGRKTLLGGFLNKVSDTLEGGGQIEEHEADNNTALTNNYDYNVLGDGTVSVGVGGNTGLHPSALADMLTQDWFKDNYIVEEPYTKGIGGRGNIVLKPLTDAPEETDANLSNLFKMDDKIRNREGYGDRVESKNNKVLAFNGANKSVFEEVQKVFEESGGKHSGAKLHNNGLALDMKNSVHRRLAKRVKDSLADKYQDDIKVAQEVTNKVGGFIVEGQGEASMEELSAFRRFTKKTKDATGNVMFNIFDAKKETQDTELGRATIKGVDVEESQKVKRDSRAMAQDLEELSNLDSETLLSRVGQKVTTSMPKVSSMAEDFGTQAGVIANEGTIRGASGTGLSYGKLNTNDGKVRDALARSGVIGGTVNTTVYGGEGIGSKINSFKDVSKIVEGNEEALGEMTKAKDDLVRIVNNKVGSLGSNTRAEALLNELSRLSGTNTEMYSDTLRNYSKLNTDYRSSNINKEGFEKGLKDISVGIEKYLKDNGLYDNAIDSMVTSKDVTESEREILGRYKTSKSSLVSEGISGSILEKLDGRSYNKMKTFVDAGNTVEMNEDNQTFDIKSENAMTDKETKEVFKMISEIV